MTPQKESNCTSREPQRWEGPGYEDLHQLLPKGLGHSWAAGGGWRWECGLACLELLCYSHKPN